MTGSGKKTYGHPRVPCPNVSGHSDTQKAYNLSAHFILEIEVNEH